MRRSRHGLPVTCIFLLALASIQCGQNVAAHRRVKGLQNDKFLSTIVEHLWIEDEE